MQEEIRKPVIGYEGLYEVSSKGRCRSLPRTVLFQRNGKQASMTLSQKNLTPRKDKDGYLRVALCRISMPKYHSIHRLVLLAFVGDPETGHECCHSNGIPSDNRLENLRWDTKQNNYKDSVAHGTASGFKNAGSGHGQSKLTEDQVRQIRAKSSGGASVNSLADEYKINRGSMWKIVNGVAWKHVTI